MRLSWPVTVAGTGGPSYGYRGFSAALHRALTEAGVLWMDEAPTALHVTPPHLFEPIADQRNVLFTMWESDQLPRDLVPRLQSADLILVPCRHNQTVFRWAGVRRPIAVCPLGLHPEHAGPVSPRPDDGRTRILWVGQASARKGWDLVGQAFAAAFPGRTDVSLTLKTMPHAGVAAQFRAGTGRVRVIAEAYTDAAMAALYRAHEVFVFPTRGEGFGLPVLEAMAAECLVLAPAISGLADFFDARVGWTLPWARRPAWYGRPVTVPDVDGPALADRLREAAPLREDRAALRTRARTRALTYTWPRTARAVLAAVESLAARAA